MSEATHRIVPPDPAKLDEPLNTLYAEMEAHRQLAQRHYEAAVEARSSGQPSQHLERMTIIEQNAALMCQLQINSVMLSILIRELVDPVEESAEPEGLVS